MSLYGAAVEHVLFPGWESIVRGRPTLDRLRFLVATERRSLDELLAIQSGELGRLVRHAWEHVPYYRARFEALGVGPDSIRSLDDLGRLPLLTRDDAIDSYQRRRSTAAPLATIKKTTSGSTGQPLAFAYDTGSEYWRQAVKLRGYGWAGYRVGKRALFYWGAPVHPLPPLRVRAKVAVDHLLKREHYVACTERTPEALDRLVEIIRREQPDVLLCYTMSGAALAHHILARGVRIARPLPVICGAERLYPVDRAAMKEAFGPSVFETWGCREMMLIAAECEAHDGLHLSMENLIVELVVSENGVDRPARPGESGDVVLTDLHNYGMPFIRYKNGDRAIAGSASACPCGRNLQKITAVDGRVSETLRGADGNPVSGLVFNVIFAVFGDAVRQFQAIQHKNGAITLKLAPKGGLDDQTRAHILSNCAKYLPGVPIQIEIVAEIPLSASGKRRVVIVEK